MILITANVEDLHARHVASLLKEQGQYVRIVDLGISAASISMTHRIGRERRAVLNLSDDEPIDLAEVAAVWYRRPTPVRIGSDVWNDGHRRFVRDEWGTALTGLLMSRDIRWVNDPVAQNTAHKPRQLEVAAGLGLRVPDTVITNSPEVVDAFLESHREGVVHKALTAPDGLFLDTRRWSETDRVALQDLSLAPAIFQEEVRGPSDIRVTIVGDIVFTARFELDAAASVDSRLNLDAPCVKYELPERVKGQLFVLMRKLGLTFGTIDMRINHDGEHVFFEVNPQGQFLYVEILTGLPIAAAIADLLRGQTGRIRYSSASGQACDKLSRRVEQDLRGPNASRS